MIGVVGAGAFGTALAVSFAAKSERVTLWGRDPEAMRKAATTRQIARLPDVTLPDAVHPIGDLADLADCEILVLAVPMQTLSQVAPMLAHLPARFVVAACKGVELGTLQGPTSIIRSALPDVVPAILSGPSFAADIARGLPTALSLGCADDAAGAEMQAKLATPTIRLYRTTDVTGVELGGALKNIIAIACGAAIGAGLGESARAALMTRGMAEMMRLATALGAARETLMGLSGLGDLALTCASPASRNFALGHAIGSGQARPNATTEGVATAGAVLDLARDHKLDMPVTKATHALVDGRLTIEDAVSELLQRDLRTE